MNRLFLYCSLFVILLFPTNGFKTKKILLENASKTVDDLRRYFSSDAIFIVTLSNSMLAARTQQRMFSELGISTSLLSIGMPEAVTKYNRPLCVIFPGTKGTQEELQDIFNHVDVTGPIWLLFVNETISDSLDDIFLNINIPFDSEFLVATSRGNDVILTEVYRVAKHLPLRSNVFGYWDESSGLTGPGEGFYERRSSLHGLQLRTANMHFPPFILISESNGKMTLGGFLGNVMNILEHSMNFTCVHSMSRDLEWGTRSENGSWDGMIGMLVRNESDMITTSLTITTERVEAVSFTAHLYSSYVRVFIQEATDRPVSFYNYISPFSLSVWLAFLVTFLAASVLLALTYNVGRKLSTTEEHSYSFCEIILIVFGGIFCQQGYPNAPKSVSSRIVFICVLVLGVLAINSYSVSMMSANASYKPGVPFNSIIEVYNDNSYQLGMDRKSVFWAEFKDAQEGILKNIYDKFLTPVSPTLLDSIPEGFQRVCKKGSKFAFVVEEETILPVDQLRCSIQHLPKHFSVNTLALALPKYSPYLGLFNYNILKLHNNGIIKKLYTSTLRKPINVKEREIKVTLEEVTPILVILLCGISGAVISLIFERRLLNVIKKILQI